MKTKKEKRNKKGETKKKNIKKWNLSDKSFSFRLKVAKGNYKKKEEKKPGEKPSGSATWDWIVQVECSSSSSCDCPHSSIFFQNSHSPFICTRNNLFNRNETREQWEEEKEFYLNLVQFNSSSKIELNWREFAFWTDSKLHFASGRGCSPKT